MNFEWIQGYCLSLPGAKQDIKWEDHFAYTVGSKIFCLTGASEDSPVCVKVSEADFDVLTERAGIGQAPYFARRQWVAIMHRPALQKAEWEHYLQASYDLIFKKLTKKMQADILTLQGKNSGSPE